MTDLMLIGGGRMGGARRAGRRESGWADATALAVVEPVSARRAELAERYPGVVLVDAPVPAAAAVLAVKPGDVPTAAGSLAGTGVKRVLSIAAGVTVAALEAAAP